jgi:hypothetical protein
MGFDLDAIHAARPKRVDTISKDMEQRPRDWLEIASGTAVMKIKDEYNDWRRSYEEPGR